MVPYNEGLYPGDDAYMIWQDQDFSQKGFALSFENPTSRQSEHWESITNFWRDARYKSGVASHGSTTQIHIWQRIKIGIS